MKLAISTLPFRDWTLKNTLKCCRGAGYDAIEIRMDYHSWSGRSLPDSSYKAAAREIEASGLRVSNLGSGIVLNDYYEKDLMELRRLLEIAGLLHTRGIRIMLGNIRLRADAPASRIDREGILRWLEEADRLAGSYGREIWVETHNEFATGKALAVVYRKTSLKHTKVIWDIMHPLEQGESVEETMKFLGEHIVHVHIKDGLPWDDPDRLIWKYTRIGEGIIPIRQIVGMLYLAGYQGYYSLEWESAWRGELEALQCDMQEVETFPEFMKQLAAEIG